MSEGVIKVLADNACELSVLFLVICVGLAIVMQSFRKKSKDYFDDDTSI
jgi:preprotein translocase subunit SecG